MKYKTLIPACAMCSCLGGVLPARAANAPDITGTWLARAKPKSQF